MKRIFHILFFVFLCVFITGCGNKDNKQIFATVLNFNVASVTKEVGDEILINNSLLYVEPWNFNDISILVENQKIATYDNENNKIICLGVGQTNIIASAFSKEGKIEAAFELIVEEKPNYAKDLLFEYDATKTLEINYDEELTILPKVVLSDDTIVSYNTYPYKVENAEVTYSKTGLISYNAKTGKLIVLNKPEQIETVTVYVKVKNGKFTTFTKSFDVVVTNYVFAKDFTIENIVFDKNNVSQIITLFTNSQISLNININPSNCNLLPIISCQNNNIVIDNGVIKTTNNELFNEIVTVKVPSSKNSYIEKQLIVNVIKPKDSFNITLTNMVGQPVSEVFVGQDYLLNINVNDNFGEIGKFINGLDYLDFYTLTSTNEENKYIINFNNANFVYEKIKLTLIYQTYNETKVVFSNEINVSVYEPTTNFNIIAKFENISLISSDDTYNLYLINNDYAEKAKEDGVAYYANVAIFTNGNNIKENNYNIYVLNQNGYELLNSTTKLNNALIELNDNGFTVTPKNVGEVVIKIVSKDYLQTEKTFKFNINAININQVTYDHQSVTELTIFYNAQNDSFNYIELNKFGYLPIYAYDKELNFELNNNLAIIENGILRSYGVGNCNLIVSSNNFEKAIKINIKPAVTHLILNENGNFVSNNEMLTITRDKLNQPIVINFKPYSNEIELNNGSFTATFVDQNLQPVLPVVLSDEIIIEANKITLYTQNYGVEFVRYSYTDSTTTIYGLIKVEVISPYSNVTSLKFENSQQNIKVNLWKTNQVNNPLIIQKDSDKPVNYSKLLVTSNDANVLVDVYGNITINLPVGTQLQQEITITICAYYNADVQLSDYYYITLYYQEEYSKIINVTFKSNVIEVNPLTQSQVYNKPECEFSNNFTCNDQISYSVSSDEFVTINNEGIVTIKENAKYITTLKTIVVYLVVTSNSEITTYSYELILINNYTYITNLKFDKEQVVINIYETNLVNNLLSYELFESNKQLYPQINCYTNNELATVDNFGNVTLNLPVGTKLNNDIIITVFAKYENLQDSYEIIITYIEPVAYIENIVFANDILEINGFEVNQFENLFTISVTDENLQCYDVITFNISENIYATINERTGVVTINNDIVNLEKEITLIVKAVVISENGNKEFSYILKLSYKANYNDIESLEFSNSYYVKGLINDGNSFVLPLIINNGDNGNYNLSLFEISVNGNIIADIVNGGVLITSNETGLFEIQIKVNELTANCTLRVLNNYSVITNETEFENLAQNNNDTYVIVKSLNLNNFATINEFKGKLFALDEVVINLNSPLFNTLSENAILENLSFNFNYDNGVLVFNKPGTSVNISSTIAVYNYGTINLCNVEVNVVALNSNLEFGGFVYNNSGTIINSNITINANNLGSNNSISAFVYANHNNIFNCKVLNSNISNFTNSAGFVYEHYGLIENSASYITLIGSNATKRAGFIMQDKNSNASVKNCDAFVTFMFTDSATKTSTYAFVGNSVGCEYINCNAYVHNNNNFSTLNFVSRGTQNTTSCYVIITNLNE